MPPSVPMSQMQPALMNSLATVRRKAKTLSVLFGVGVLLVAAIGLLLGVVLIDYLLELPIVPRLIFILGAAAGVIYTLWKWVLIPMMTRLTINDLAGRLETAFPQFDDRLRSTVDFIRSDTPGSAVMKQRVVSEADKLAASMNLDNALVTKPVMYSMGAGVAALVLTVLLSVVFSDYARVALNRLFMSGEKFPRRVEIEMVKELPQKVPAGQRVDLKMRLKKGDKQSMRARVIYRYNDGREQQQYLTRNEDGTYTASLDARTEGVLNVKIVSGDGETQEVPITVVPRLAINHVKADITPPTYIKNGEMASVNLSEGPATMTLGSQVAINITFNKPLAPGQPVTLESMKPDTKLPAITWDRRTPTLAVGMFTVMEAMRFRIHAKDADYFENNGLEEYDLLVKPDQMPSVIIESPRRNLDQTLTSSIFLSALAEDDFEIAKMTLVVNRMGENKKEWKVPLEGWTKVESTGDRKRFKQTFDWKLSEFAKGELKTGDVLEYRIEVCDSYNLDGAVHPPVSSGKLKINIISQEALDIQTGDALRALAERIRQQKIIQERNRAETDSLTKEVDKKVQVEGAQKVMITRFGDQESILANATKGLGVNAGEILSRMKENNSANSQLMSIAEQVQKILDNCAEDPMAEAMRRLNEAAGQTDPKLALNAKGELDNAKAEKAMTTRDNALADSVIYQEKAVAQLDAALKLLTNLGSLETIIKRLESLLDEQQKNTAALVEKGRPFVGKEVKDLTKDQWKDLNEIKAKENELAEKTEKLVHDMQKAASELATSEPVSSEALTKAVSQSHEHMVVPNMNQASANAGGNMQAASTNKMKAAEVGLQAMAGTMRAAAKRKLEQLEKELHEIEDAISNNLRRQAGHNIDNLLIQGTPATIALITADLMKLAERKEEVSKLTKPETAGLTNYQIITEKNTRNIIKLAEAMPVMGAEIAAEVSKAANAMERAVVGLKETKLAEAYDPSQIKALDALKEALNKAHEALAELAEEMEQKQMDTIKQVYQKALADQKKINQETLEIDVKGKTPDGKYNRVSTVTLSKMPAQQEAIAKTVQMLNSDLEELGSVAYLWANKDIIETMTGVKADLGMPKTDVSVQAEQERICEQLAAMIRNLETRKKKSMNTMEMQSGAGVPPPVLPSEVELRLVNDLQIAVNNSAKTIAAQPAPDKTKLGALANRQGSYRNILDQMFEKSSRGTIKMDPEPDPKEIPPGEIDKAVLDTNEMVDFLLGSEKSQNEASKTVKEVGLRMAQSKIRMGVNNDPGKTTQIVQANILQNMDTLIQMARQQDVQIKMKKGPRMKPPPPPKGRPTGITSEAQGGPGKGMGGSGMSPGQGEQMKGGDSTDKSLKEIRERASEWGGVSPNIRESVMQGANDKTIGKYEGMVRDYYENLGKKASEK